LEDPSADNGEITRPSLDLGSPYNQEPLERARYITITTDPITRYTKIGLDWTIKKDAQGSTATVCDIRWPDTVSKKITAIETQKKILVSKSNHVGQYCQAQYWTIPIDY